ncbi:MAG TPA: TetR/AcrR family transcriptional regulator [Candidatus Acidoferrum sp.]
MKKDTKRKKRGYSPISRRLAVKRSAAHLGRPRAFDPEKALEAALWVFWTKGYEGTALSDLTAAMGINRPSIYATFGNKEALFRKALDRYSERMTGYTTEALKEPTARAVAERLMTGTADLLSYPGNPKGCLMVQGALACGDQADPIRKELIARRATGEAALRERFERAKAEGDLPAGADPGDLARYVMAVMHGMSVQSAGGASREELLGVIDLSMRAWPRA